MHATRAQVLAFIDSGGIYQPLYNNVADPKDRDPDRWLIVAGSYKGNGYPSPPDPKTSTWMVIAIPVSSPTSQPTSSPHARRIYMNGGVSAVGKAVKNGNNWLWVL